MKIVCFITPLNTSRRRQEGKKWTDQMKARRQERNQGREGKKLEGARKGKGTVKKRKGNKGRMKQEERCHRKQRKGNKVK